MGAPHISFFHLRYGAPLRLVSVLTIWGPLRSVFVHTTCIWGPPQVSFFAYYRGPPQISFFAYYMGPPSSQLFRLLYRSLLMPVSSLTMWGPPDQFLRILYGAHSDQFLSLLAPHPRSLSSLTIWGPPSGQFLCLLYEGPLRSIFCLLCGGPLRSDSSHTIWMGGGGGGVRSVSSLTIGGPLRSVYSHTIWSPLRSISSLTICGGPLR